MSHMHNSPLGQAYAASGKSLEAIDAFKEALKIDPKMIEAYQALGRFYGEQGKYDDAVIPK